MARDDIKFSRIVGVSSKQAHTNLPVNTFERELGRNGFFGPATMMYHKNPPTGWIEWEGELRPRAFDLCLLKAEQTSPWVAPVILHNNNTKIRFWNIVSDMDNLVRNADGDDLLFIHSGNGGLYCDYGYMDFKTGDYIVIPRGTMWRIETIEKCSILMIENTNSAYKLPEKGLVGRHAIFDQAMLEVPDINNHFQSQQTKEKWIIEIKRENKVSRVFYPFNPLDAVGWQGDLSVVKINVNDIRPLMSHRYHLPPSAHTTWVGEKFVVCTFVPRPFETDPDAIKVPFFHNNDDYDEVIFYHAGNFFSRDNIHPGMLSFHPCGFTHGPHPKALQNMLVQNKEATDEYAIMIDTRNPLYIADAAHSVEWAEYHKSWLNK